MTKTLIGIAINLGWALLCFVILFVIIFVIVSTLMIFIKKKDDVLKERDVAKMELQQIQAEKGVEWDKYKELTNELDKLRIAHLNMKNKNEKLQEDNAKLKVSNENILAVNKELKKEKSK